MKKSAPKNQPVLPENPPKKAAAIKLSSTNQVILAAIVVLLIFIVAVMSSSPKTGPLAPAEPKQPPSEMSTAVGESRQGEQIARISITRSDSPQAEVAANGTSSSMMLAEIAKDPMMAVAAGSRVKFKIDRFQKLALQPLKFNVYDEFGKEILPDDLQTIHERKMHLYVMSANLREYTHALPEYSNGTWNASVNLLNPGTYYAYVGMSPIKEGHLMLRSELVVRDPSSATPDFPGLTPNNLAITGDVSALLNLTDAGLKNLSTMMFSLTRNGQNVNDVRPYLGAYGYLMVVRHGDILLCANAHAFPIIDETKGIFEFGVKFHKSGRYTAFAEFKVGDKVLLFPITFEVQ